MLGKTTKPTLTYPPDFGNGIRRGQSVLFTAFPRTGLPKSDMIGYLARQMYTQGKWTKEQFQEFCQQRLNQLDPMGLEGRSAAVDFLKESNKDV